MNLAQTAWRVVRAPDLDAVELLYLMGGRWLEAVRFRLGDAGESMDHRLREVTGALPVGGPPPNMEHLSILTRWHGSSWRDGEWIGFESVEKIRYPIKLVNAIGRVHVATSRESL